MLSFRTTRNTNFVFLVGLPVDSVEVPITLTERNGLLTKPHTLDGRGYVTQCVWPHHFLHQLVNFGGMIGQGERLFGKVMFGDDQV
jgi:hypothetical protein